MCAEFLKSGQGQGGEQPPDPEAIERLRRQVWERYGDDNGTPSGQPGQPEQKKPTDNGGQPTPPVIHKP